MENEINFYTILQNYDSENEMLRTQAANYIEQFRDTKIFEYLENLYIIITHPESSQHVKEIAIIFSYRAFELIVPTNQFCTKFQYIEENKSGFLNKFLEESIELFSTFPLRSGYLFSSLFFIYFETDKDNNIIQDLCERLIQENDLNFINAALIGIEDICKSEIISLSPEQYNPILTIVLGYINSPDNKNTETIKKKSISIISLLIPKIDYIFNDFEMTNTILRSISTSILKPETKNISYDCIRNLISSQFALFIHLSEKILSIAFIDINAAVTSKNENLICSICNMLEQLTYEAEGYEEDFLEKLNEDRIGILQKIFPDFFKPLLLIACNKTSSYPDSLDEYDISTAALKTISLFIVVIPDFSFAFLLNFFEENSFFQAQTEQIPHEIFCNFISFIVTFCDIENVEEFLSQFYIHLQGGQQIKVDASEMINQIVHLFLDDSSPQVIDAALNLLESIVKRNELSEKLDISFYSNYIDQIFLHLEEGAKIAGDACNLVQDILKLLKKLNGLSEIDLVSMFLKLISYSGYTDEYFVYSLFECIRKVIKLLNVDQFKEVFEPFIKLVIDSFGNELLNRNQSDILYMFRKYCICAKNKSITNKDQFNCEELFSPAFDTLYELFTSGFNETNDFELLYILAYIASISTTKFNEHLEEFITLIAQIGASFLENHKGEMIDNFVELILFLKKTFDIEKYIKQIAELSFEIMKVCVSSDFNDLDSFSDLMFLFSEFIRNYFSEVSDYIVPLVELFSQIILKAQNINNSDLKSKFLINCSILLKNIFEKIDHDSASGLFEISFRLANEIICCLSEENTKEEQFEQIIYLFCQMSNVNPEPFQELSKTEQFSNFFKARLQNENLNSTVQTFLSTIGVEVNSQ